MNIKSANKINLHDKPKVLFISHPHDFEKYFEQISDDILFLRDCAIYYYEKGEIPSKEEWELDVFDANLIVIPISSAFLNEHSAAMDVYDYAQQKNIPILLIMMEGGLDRKCNEVCGEKQYLDRGNYDPTSIPYIKKLEDFLSSVIIGDELTQTIKEAFVSYLFLSYRKKDRKHAQQLIKMIHANQYTQDVAVWYDEFIQPNENFNDSISEALTNSDLFLMAVTPNLVNEDNYVISIEYPAAIKENKIILPVELIETEYQKLKERFPAIPECVSIHDSDMFFESLFQALPHISEKAGTKDAVHDYYIGLAYLHGIDVEIDTEKAVVLISSAAEDGIHEAARDLANLYYQGTFIKSDYIKATFWQKKQIEILEVQMEAQPSDEIAINTANAYRMLIDMEVNSTSRYLQTEEIIENCKKAMKICAGIQTSYQNMGRVTECMLDTMRHLAIVYESIGEYDKALKVYRDSYSMRISILDLIENISEAAKVTYIWRIAQLNYDMGILFRKMGNHKDAVMKMEEAIRFYLQITEIAPEYLPFLANVYQATADIAISTDVNLAEKYIQQSLGISEKMYKKDERTYELLYAKTLLERSCISSRTGILNYDEQIECCHKAEAIFEKYIDSGSIDVLACFINTLYRLACTYEKKFEMNTANTYFERAVDISLKNLDIFENEVQLEIAHVLYDFGVFLPSYSYSVKCDHSSCLARSLEFLEKALSIFKRSHTNCAVYVDDARKAIEMVKELIHMEERKDNADASSDNSDVLNYLSLFMFYFNKSDKAEKQKQYRLAYLNYKAAEKFIPNLEKYSKESIVLMRMDLYDRLAYCYEMENDLVNAEFYYKAAVELLLADAEKSKDMQIIKECISCLNKLISFYEDFGKNDKAEIYRKKLQQIKNHVNSILQEEAADEFNDSNLLIELPDHSGNIIQFKIFCTIVYDLHLYAVLIPDAAMEISEEKVLVFKLEHEGELSIKPVSASVENKVYQMFKTKYKERFVFND